VNFSEEHPEVGKAFEVHSGHLADSAVEFLRISGDVSKLSIRTKQERGRDRCLIAAQEKLENFGGSIRQEIPVEYLLQ
jgi:hypothetical protein